MLLPDKLDVTKPDYIASLLRDLLTRRDVEQFLALYAKPDFGYAGGLLIASGTLGSVELDMTKIWKRAVERGATYVLCGHSHTSQDLTPSGDDLATTKLLSLSAIEYGGLIVMEHYIIHPVKGYNRLFQNLVSMGLMEGDHEPIEGRR